MKKRVITIVTLMMFVLTNVISVIPAVYADEIETIFYEYDGYTIGYNVLESWDDTQKVSVSIQNTGEETIENWMKENIYLKVHTIL